MKKNVKFLVLFFVLFFSFSFSVNAKDITTGINFEAHEHFNYFYEFKHQTPFYMFLSSLIDWEAIDLTPTPCGFDPYLPSY